MKFILWPFKIILSLISSIITLTGKAIGIILGLVIMILGMAATVTIVGGIIGIPLIIFGLLILIKSIF
ncbi:hypothetical protein HBE96_12230 [Clostridium sp. P21]|uniref:Uncharacterized protein n=1 Tax=Clostridium muellerianum TaxID=2716538 RepID=A0A7Y0EH99_9CLOT|nr:hypothetical protein [Clostridium muellerianum]NMM63433.1 hypothetical protein [Clostridium muellerianum]